MKRKIYMLICNVVLFIGLLVVSCSHPIPTYTTLRIENHDPLLIEKRIVTKWIEGVGCERQDVDVGKMVDAVYLHSYGSEVSPYLVFGLIQQESCFNTNAHSSADAKGLMQVVEKWWEHLILDRDLFDLEVGIPVGIEILQHYLVGTNGNLRKALEKYSGGATSYYEKVARNRDSLERYVYSEMANHELIGSEVVLWDELKVPPKNKDLIAAYNLLSGELKTEWRKFRMRLWFKLRALEFRLRRV